MPDITKTCYGSWENLLELIREKLDFYLRIYQIFMLLKDEGLRPGYMLDETHPAYFSDEIARHCLATHDPHESVDSALERCIIDKLHQRFLLMKGADLSKAKMGGCIWEQFPRDALLRLVWRQRGERLAIPCYLQKDSPTQLTEPFTVEVEQGLVRLTRGDVDRQYEVDTTGLDLPDFCREMDRCFRLATEDCGYFAPEYLWLSHRAIQRG
jgi:hypothetical protein